MLEWQNIKDHLIVKKSLHQEVGVSLVLVKHGEQMLIILEIIFAHGKKTQGLMVTWKMLIGLPLQMI